MSGLTPVQNSVGQLRSSNRLGIIKSDLGLFASSGNEPGSRTKLQPSMKTKKGKETQTPIRSKDRKTKTSIKFLCFRKRILCKYRAARNADRLTVYHRFKQSLSKRTFDEGKKLTSKTIPLSIINHQISQCVLWVVLCECNNTHAVTAFIRLQLSERTWNFHQL